MNQIAKIRGTIDKLEQDMLFESSILDTIQDWLAVCNFSKVATPILEKTDLFIESIGEGTDVVNKELFFIQSRDPNDKICLRPELTAGIFRCYLENKSELTMPWKVFAAGPCFRYERPQKGRWREFDQVSIEVIDAKSEMFDAELLVNLDRLFFHKFGMTKFLLKINYIGGQEERLNYKTELLKFLEQKSQFLCVDCNNRKNTNILRCLDCKNQQCILLLLEAPKILDYLTPESQAVFARITDNLNHNSVNFSVDPMLVRGLDYYQGLVFEFVSGSLGSQSSFAGGGRYELATRLGSKTVVPSIGAGIGLGRLAMILQEENLVNINVQPLIAIVPLSKAQESLALIVVDYLRKSGRRCDIILDKDSIKSKIKQAVRVGAQKAIFIGEDEQASNCLTVKDLVSGEEQKCPQQAILEII